MFLPLEEREFAHRHPHFYIRRKTTTTIKAILLLYVSSRTRESGLKWKKHGGITLDIIKNLFSLSFINTKALLNTKSCCGISLSPDRFIY